MGSNPPEKARLTWTNVSRAIGVWIILCLLAAFMVSTFAEIRLDSTVVLAFLGVATTLIGVPAGVNIVIRRQDNSK